MARRRHVDAYGTNRQRLTELAARNPGYRLLPDNFHGVEQSVVVAKGGKALVDFVNGVLDEARSSGLIAASIERAGLVERRRIRILPDAARTGIGTDGVTLASVRHTK